MSDLISRQAAIEVIDAAFPVDPMKSEYTQGLACGVALAKTYVEQLPSVQPELAQNLHNACEDLISRQDAIDVVADALKGVFVEYQDIAEKLIGKMPSAQPERKKGKWEKIEVIPEAYDIAGVKTWASKMRCNQCGFTTFAIEGGFAQYYFCPNCGSYNGGEQE